MSSAKQKVIHTACPLPMEVLKEYFEDKENTSFLIDYKNSKLDANAIMIYLSNLNLDADFDEATYDDRDSLKELVAAYMSTTTALVDIEQMAREALAICCQHRGVVKPYPFTEEDVENYNNGCWENENGYYERLDEVDDFIEEHKDIVERWCTMLDSSIVYNMHCFKDEFRDFIDTRFEKIEDPDYVGINYVHTYTLDWIGLYISQISDIDTGISKPKYFENQFNEYRFKGNNMYSYFVNENNPLAVFSQVATNIKPEEFGL